MKRDQLRDTLIEELTAIAPDIDPSTVEDHVPLRDEYDLDSMDALNLLAAVHKRLGISIPEKDYARMHTLGELLDYIEQKGAG